MNAATTTTSPEISLKQELYNESLQDLREQLERMVAECKRLESEVESGEVRCKMWSEAEGMARFCNELKERFSVRALESIGLDI